MRPTTEQVIEDIKNKVAYSIDQHAKDFSHVEVNLERKIHHEVSGTVHQDGFSITIDFY